MYFMLQLSKQLLSHSKQRLLWDTPAISSIHWLRNIIGKDMVNISQNPGRPRFHRWYLNHWPDMMACDCRDWQWEETEIHKFTKREADRAGKIKGILNNVAKQTAEVESFRLKTWWVWCYDLKGETSTGTGGEPVAFTVSKWCVN